MKLSRRMEMIIGYLTELNFLKSVIQTTWLFVELEVQTHADSILGFFASVKLEGIPKNRLWYLKNGILPDWPSFSNPNLRLLSLFRLRQPRLGIFISFLHHFIEMHLLLRDLIKDTLWFIREDKS